MRGKARAAQAHDGRVAHALEDLGVGDGGDVLADAHALDGGELAVVVDDDAVRRRAGQHASLLDGLHLAGAGTDDVGGYEAVGLGDALAHQHVVALLHDGLGRLADVLGQREDHLALGQEIAQQRVPAQLLALRGMHAAAKGVFHNPQLPFYIYYRSLALREPPTRPTALRARRPIIESNSRGLPAASHTCRECYHKHSIITFRICKCGKARKKDDKENRSLCHRIKQDGG